MVNVTTVLKKKCGTQQEYYQYYITIPLQIAKELRLEGKNIHWKIRRSKSKKGKRDKKILSIKVI